MILKQYISDTTGGIGNYSRDNVEDYCSFITDGTSSYIIERNDGSGRDFENPCLKLTTTFFSSDYSYYLDVKIKQLSDSQDVSIYLRDSRGVNPDQYIDNIIVSGGIGVIDKDFIFTPFATYDTVVFVLKRIATDYTSGNPRKMVVCFNELTVLKNIIDTKRLTGTSLIELEKIGVQTKPFTMMCINKDGIFVGRNGIYEIRNGVKISSFTIFKRGINLITPTEVNNGIEKEEDLFNSITDVSSLLDHPKDREIVNFSFDYCYK